MSENFTVKVKKPAQLNVSVKPPHKLNLVKKLQQLNVSVKPPQKININVGATSPFPVASKFVLNENLLGLIDGNNKLFEVHHEFTPPLIWVYKNGLRLHMVDDYIQVLPNQIQFTDAPLPGDSLIVDYIIGAIDIIDILGGDQLFELDQQGDIEPK